MGALTDPPAAGSGPGYQQLAFGFGLCPNGIWSCIRGTVDGAVRITKTTSRTVVAYLPSNQREAFEVFHLVETVLVTGVAAGATVVNVTVVCPAATAAGGPVGAAACVFSTAATATLTVAAAAAVVKETQHYIDEKRRHKAGGSSH